MQVVQPIPQVPPAAGIPVPVAVPPTSLLPTLNPGPILLLLLLPTLPLLLFGLGARPPNVDSWPFSIQDVFTTGALATVAGAVVIGVIIWPDGLAGMGSWVSQGRMAKPSALGTQLPPGGASGRVGGGNVPGSVGYMKQEGPGGIRQEQIYGAGSAGLKARLPPAPPPVPRHVIQLQALRSAFHPWWSPERPHLPTALFVSVVTLTLLTIGMGHFLGVIYDQEPAPSGSSSGGRSSGESRSRGSGGPDSSGKDKDKDASGGSAWVQREMSKRKSEKDDPKATEARLAKDLDRERKEKKSRQEKMKPDEFEAWRKSEEKKRSKEVETLKKMLIKEKLPLIGLGETSSDGDKGKKEKEGKGGSSSDGGSKGGIGSKLKRAFLGKDLADGLERQKSSGGGAAAAATAAPAKPAGGPGWQPANQAVVDATLMQSARNAESNAEKLKAGMKAS